MTVRFSRESKTDRPGWRTRFTWDRTVAVLWMTGLLLLSLFGLVPFWTPAWYTLVGQVTFVTYATDKAQAGLAKRRVPERVLHVLEAVGGWPGALVAQRWFRHKTRKTRFQAIFWLIVLAHAVVVGWWVSRSL